jgi:surface antigen
MTATRDEFLLQAWLDGEADAAQCAEAEAWLAEDPAARDLLRALQAGDALLREAVDAPLREPVPPALLARVEAILAGQVTRLPPRPAASAPAPVAEGAAGLVALPPRRRWLPLALAASIALALVLPAGAWLWSAKVTEQRLAAQRVAHDQALAALETQLQQTLETQVSGTPLPWQQGGEGSGQLIAVRTYKSAAGQWCREYRIAAEIQGQPYQERGIACRGPDGRWERKVILLDETAAEPPPPPPPPGQGT